MRFRPAASASLPPGLRRAREVDAAHGRVLDELVADRRSLARRVRDDVQHAGRQPRLGEDLAPDQPADVAATSSDGFEHDGVAERERRRDRARGEDQRGVPRRDRADDADRPPHAHREPPGVSDGSTSPDRRVRERRGLTKQARARSGAGTSRSRRCSRSRGRASSTTSSPRRSRMSAALRKTPASPRAASATSAGRRPTRPRWRAAHRRAVPAVTRGDDLAGERIAVVEGPAAGASAAPPMKWPTPGPGPSSWPSRLSFARGFRVETATTPTCPTVKTMFE